MAIIDIEISKTQGKEGIKKGIDENAVSLILDTLQITQYVYPEFSSVRELSINSVDSQKEKEKVLKILKGEAKIEDFWIHREDPKYKDSNYDESYYKLECLDQENNNVELFYVEGKEGVGWCDKFIVKDYGVGLGGRRLENYLSALGYSTKRNSTTQVGGFGFGSRASLSLRNDYYTTETVHNNKRFLFNIYSYKVDSLIGKFNSEGKENEFILIHGDIKVYYEITNSTNYTIITVPCKRHHKNNIVRGIKSQLLYFNNIVFKEIDSDGDEEIENFKARIFYDSENIVIANQNYYSKPHVLIVKDKTSTEYINYGYVDFKAMEMQELYSPVGFKCTQRQTIRNIDGTETLIQDGVDLLPSREQIIFSDNTKAYIKGIIEKAKDEASALVEKQLQEKDFLKWLNKAINVLGRTGGDPALNALSKIVDSSDLSPKYSEDHTIKYCSPALLFWGMNVRLTTKSYDYKSSKETINRREIDTWHGFNPSLVYLQKEGTSNIKDFYIISTNGGNSFYTIQLIDNDKLYDECIFKEKEGIIPSAESKKWTEEYVKGLIAKRDRILALIQASELVKDYDGIEVPEDFNKKFTEQELKTDEAVKMKSLTPKELRALNEQLVMYTPYVNRTYNKHQISQNQPYKWNKIEPKMIDFRDEMAPIYYGYVEEEALLCFIMCIMETQIKSGCASNIEDMYCLDDSYLSLVRVSRSISKKALGKHKYINKFIEDRTEKEVGMSEFMVKWQTGKLIYESLDKLQFFRNYKIFNEKLHLCFMELSDYCNVNYYSTNEKVNWKYNKLTNSEELMKSTMEYCSKVNELQLFIREHKEDGEAIKHKSLEVFGIDSVEKAVGIDLEIYDKLQLLLDYAEVVGDLFNKVTCLTLYNVEDRYEEEVNKDILRNIDFETETLIKEIIEFKGLYTFDTSLLDVTIVEEPRMIEEEKKEKELVF